MVAKKNVFTLLFAACIILSILLVPQTTTGTGWYISVISPNENQTFNDNVVIEWTIKPDAVEGLNFSVYIGHDESSLVEMANGSDMDFLSTYNVYRFVISASKLDEGTYIGKIVAWKGEETNSVLTPHFSVSHTVEEKLEAYIASPSDNSTFTEGEPIHFSAVINGTYSSIVWASDIDGVLSESKEFTSSNLSAGRHNITLTVYGSGGKSVVDTVEILVKKIIKAQPIILKRIDIEPGVPFTGQDVNITLETQNPNNFNTSDMVIMYINNEVSKQFPVNLMPLERKNITTKMNFSAAGTYKISFVLKSDPSMSVMKNITVKEIKKISSNETTTSNGNKHESRRSLLDFSSPILWILIGVIVVAVAVIAGVLKKKKKKQDIPSVPESAITVIPQPKPPEENVVSFADEFDLSTMDNWGLGDTGKKKKGNKGEKKKKSGKSSKKKGKKGSKGSEDEFDNELKAVMEEVFK